MNHPARDSKSLDVASAAPLRRGRQEELAKSVNLWLVEMEPAWLHDALDAQELIRGLQGEVDGLRHQIQALEQQLEQRKKDNRALAHEMVTHRSRAEAADAQVDQLRQQIQALEQRLSNQACTIGACYEAENRLTDHIASLTVRAQLEAEKWLDEARQSDNLAESRDRNGHPAEARTLRVRASILRSCAEFLASRLLGGPDPQP